MSGYTTLAEAEAETLIERTLRAYRWRGRLAQVALLALGASHIVVIGSLLVATHPVAITIILVSSAALLATLAVAARCAHRGRPSPRLLVGLYARTVVFLAETAAVASRARRFDRGTLRLDGPSRRRRT